MSKRNLVVLIVVVAVVAGALYWYFVMNKGAFVAPEEAAPAPQTLGGDIYEKSQNPIQDKVPTLDPVANPVQGLYKNPFQ
ncbi:MAG: hypothetical protein HY434_02260 [Candidatus Liptonbacteria bacterium]|nr:hypothetical protein [Candidatus Liptonbacteria bacterium]